MDFLSYFGIEGCGPFCTDGDRRNEIIEYPSAHQDALTMSTSEKEDVIPSDDKGRRNEIIEYPSAHQDALSMFTSEKEDVIPSDDKGMKTSAANRAKSDFRDAMKKSGSTVKNDENKNHKQNQHQNQDNKGGKANQKVVPKMVLGELKSNDAGKKAKVKEEAPKPSPKPFPKPDGPFSDGSKLQVLVEHGWIDCSEDETHQVGLQLAAETKKFTVLARGSVYIFDFSDPDACTQTNAATKKTHQVRIMKP